MSSHDQWRERVRSRPAPPAPRAATSLRSLGLAQILSPDSPEGDNHHDYLDWILHGPPTTPDDRPAAQRQAAGHTKRRMAPSASLPMLPSAVSRAVGSPAAPPACLPMTTFRPQESGYVLSVSSSWRFANSRAAQPAIAHVSRQALAHDRALRASLRAALEQERVPTPQFAARRDLPAGAGLPRTAEHDSGAAMRYWAPPSSSSRLDGYMFHEPGVRVRDNLYYLEELKGRPANRQRIEARHRVEVRAARARWRDEVQQHREHHAASTVQRAWRSGAAESLPA